MNLVSIKDLDRSFIEEIFGEAGRLKKIPRGSELPLAGKTLALLFEKPSTRTRVSFEVGMFQLGGYTLYLSRDEVRLGERESIPDVARVLSRYVDGVVLRTFSHGTVEEFAAWASVPVINGLSDRLHPCQVLADIFTIREKLGGGKLKVAYVGDGNNVCHSWLYGAAKTGMNLSVACPEGYGPGQEIVEEARMCARDSGAGIEVVSDPVKAVKDADVVYTDVWASMGREAEKNERRAVFSAYRVDAVLLGKTGKKTLVMHCLPAYRGEEITDEMMDGPRSIVFDQAENRMHLQKAVLAILMGKGVKDG